MSLYFKVNPGAPSTKFAKSPASIPSVTGRRLHVKEDVTRSFIDKFYIQSLQPPMVRGHQACRLLPVCASSPSGEHAAPVPGALSEREVEQLWEAAPRPLLKLGSSGAQETHFRSIREMLETHILVRIQLNGDPAGAPQLGEMLEAECSARLVEVRGKNILLAKGDLQRIELLAFAEEALKKIRRYHEKRMKKPETEEQRERREGAAGGASRQGAGGNRQAMGGNRSAVGGNRQGAPRLQRGDREREQQAGKMPSGPRIDDLISKSITRGPATKDTLMTEWVRLAGQIQQQETAEETGKGYSPSLASPLKKKSKAPWKKGS